MTKYLLIDTNNLVQLLERGFKNVSLEEKDLEELLSILEGNKTILLIPEVIKIEYERIYIEKLEELEKAFKEQREKIDIKSEETKEKIQKQISKILEEELQSLKQIHGLVFKIFKHRNSKLIKLDSDILLNSYKKIVAGKKPFNKQKARLPSGFIAYTLEPDVVIIESIKAYLNGKDNYLILICSDDPDFWDEEKKSIDPNLKREFKETRLYQTLRDCLRNEFASKLPPLSAPSGTKKEETNGRQRQPPIPIDLLIDELERSSSFDNARRNMENILTYKAYLKPSNIIKILDAMLSNPHNYIINQVMAVDTEQEFTKKLFIQFKEEKDIWQDFADNLKLFYDKKPSYLKDYNWLFERLGMKTYVTPDDIPF